MKKYFILLLLHSTVNAQSVLPLSGFQNVLSIYNPAAAGINSGTECSIIHKTQWTGFPQAPKFYGISLNSPLNYERFGIGFNLYKESSGVQNFLSANGSFSYKINLAKGRLSYGVKLGLVQWNEDFSNLTVKDPGEAVNGQKKTALDIGGGLLYKNKKYLVGLSANYSPSIYIGNKFINKIYYTISFGMKQKISSTLDLHPALLVRYTSGFSPMLSVSMPFEYKRFLWVGASYRSSSILSIMAGVNLHQIIPNLGNRISVFYYFDYSGNRKSMKLGNSHEILLFYIPGKNKSVESIKRNRATVSPLFFD